MPKSHLDTEITLNTPGPIKQLSVDVLRQIFELHCKDDSLTLSSDHRGWEPTSRITLSHVCSEWRAIMLNIRTFWNSIKILHGIRDTPQILDSIVKKADKLLSRAKGLPCSVEVGSIEGLDRSDRDKGWHNNIVRDLMLLHKVNKLRITFTDQQLRDLWELPDDRFSCIEDLYITYFNPHWNNFHTVRTVSPLRLHSMLSSLRSFSISSTPMSGYYRFDDIPWHNLRHIEFRVMTSLPFCFNALERSAAVLETYSLLLTDDYFFEPPRPVPLHLSRLRALEVFTSAGEEDLEEEVLKYFLLSLHFPNLKSLKLGSLNPWGIKFDLEMLLKVQHASKMQLEELRFTESTLGVDVRTLLLAFPSLICLELPKKVTFTNDTMAEIGAGSLGAFLQHLTIDNPDLDLGKLLQMVRARACVGINGNEHGSNVVGFECVTLHCNEAKEDVRKEVLDMIQQIKLSGVDLDVIFAN